MECSTVSIIATDLTQVKKVEQQEMKSYKLLSSSVNFDEPTDPLYREMWYIVSGVF